MYPPFDSDGVHPPFATEVSGAAVGWQQAAINLYAETTFVCPAYWLADAYASSNGNGNGTKDKKAWRYQLSPPNSSFHGYDLELLMADPTAVPINPGGTLMDATFRRGFQSVWAHFIVGGDPTLPSSLAAVGSGLEAARAPNWQPWGQINAGQPRFDLLNLNVTSMPPYRPDWTVVDAMTFEGGRGARCALWAELGFN